MLKRTSLYTALTVALMTTFLLMSFAVLQYIPFRDTQEALLMRAPELTTKNWAIFDVHTGIVRYGSNVDTALPIASVTKLFTAYIVLDTKSDAEVTTITWTDLATTGRSGKLTHGSSYTLGELLFPLLIESSNDAGAAIARTLGDIYLDALGELPRTHGLTHTTLVDPTGLSPENVSSARDLAHFYAYIKNQYPRITDITQLNIYVGEGYGLINNNPLRTFPSFVGGKHGFIPEAGKTFVGSFTLPEDDREVGIVLLGSNDLVRDVTNILESIR